MPTAYEICLKKVVDNDITNDIILAWSRKSQKTSFSDCRLSCSSNWSVRSRPRDPVARSLCGKL